LWIVAYDNQQRNGRTEYKICTGRDAVKLCGENVGDPHPEGLSERPPEFGGGGKEGAGFSWDSAPGTGWWASEPGVGGAFDGLAARMEFIGSFIRGGVQ
jgi:hypothetical protein